MHRLSVLSTCLTAVVAVLACHVAPTHAEAPRSPKVLIIGIDGCRPDALHAAATPHLDALIATGAFSFTAQAGPRTKSGPGWTSMLTGVWAPKHGVHDNAFRSARLRDYPHFFVRLKAVRPEAVTASIVNWRPINRRIVAGADILGMHNSDRAVVRRAVRVLSERDVDALFVHLDEVDAAGHASGYGPDQPAYLEAIAAADARVGQIVDAMRARSSVAAEDWLVLVSTDHGGEGMDHGADTPACRTVFFIANGDAVRPGELSPAPGLVDVAATALVHLGARPLPEWDLDGRAVGLRSIGD